MRRDIILFKITLVSVRAGFYGRYDLFNLVDSGSNYGKERKAAESYKGLCSMGENAATKFCSDFCLASIVMGINIVSASAAVELIFG